MSHISTNSGEPTPTSNPYRCKVLYIPLQNRQTGWKGYVWKTKRSNRDRVDTEWRLSAKATSATGFLDLPKEIRDIIYQYISDRLNRVGLPWVPNHSEPKHDPNFDSAQPQISPRTGLPRPEADVADLAIMRTCYQLYSEFVEVLYASHIQVPFVVTGKYTLPIYSKYAHLVKRIFMAFPSSFTDNHWAAVSQISCAFVETFPALTTLRVGWHGSPSNLTHVDETPDLWNNAQPESEGAYIESVSKCEEFIRKQIAEGMVFPRQLRLLALSRGQLVESCSSEALKNVQLSAMADQDGVRDSSMNDKGKGIARILEESRSIRRRRVRRRFILPF